LSTERCIIIIYEQPDHFKKSFSKQVLGKISANTFIGKIIEVTDQFEASVALTQRIGG